MKRFIKFLSVFTLIFVAMLLLTANTPKASANGDGSLVSNSIVLEDGCYLTKTWTHENYNLNCFNKIVVPQRGYITFSIDKPFLSDGDVGYFEFFLYNSSGEIIWAADSYKLTDSFSDYYEYNIGLNSGTYYMNIDPSFYIWYDDAPIVSTYGYSFTEADNWEIESNDDKASATSLKVNTYYNGVSGDESYDVPHCDYYSVYLTAGNDYKLEITNYSKLTSGYDTSVYMYDTLDDEKSLTYDFKTNTDKGYYDFSVTTTGTYYFKLQSTGWADNIVDYQIAVKKVPKKTLSAPTSLKAKSIKTTQITLTWKSISGAQKYTVYYSTNGKKWKSATTTANSITIKELKPGTNYSFKVKAISGKINSAYSSVLKTATKVKKVTISSLKSEKAKQIAVQWKTVTGASGYVVEYSTSKKFTSKTTKKVTVKNGSSKKTTLKKLKSGKKYYVRIKAYKTVNKKSVYGAYSSVKSIKVK